MVLRRPRHVMQACYVGVREGAPAQKRLGVDVGWAGAPASRGWRSGQRCWHGSAGGHAYAARAAVGDVVRGRQREAGYAGSGERRGGLPRVGTSGWRLSGLGMRALSP